MNFRSRQPYHDRTVDTTSLTDPQSTGQKTRSAKVSWSETQAQALKDGGKRPNVNDQIAVNLRIASKLARWGDRANEQRKQKDLNLTFFVVVVITEDRRQGAERFFLHSGGDALLWGCNEQP